VIALLLGLVSAENLMSLSEERDLMEQLSEAQSMLDEVKLLESQHASDEQMEDTLVNMGPGPVLNLIPRDAVENL